jgi:hypothetical protein
VELTVRQSENSCKSLIDTIHGGCITRTTDCWRIIPAGKSLVVHIYCLKIRSSISSSSCKEIFQLSMSAYTICRSRPTVSKGSWSNQTENLTISYLAYIPCLHKACKKNYRSMSLGRPSRGVGMLKDGKAGTLNRLPVAPSSSSIPSGKLGILLRAPAKNCNQHIIQQKALIHVRQESRNWTSSRPFIHWSCLRRSGRTANGLRRSSSGIA